VSSSLLEKSGIVNAVVSALSPNLEPEVQHALIKCLKQFSAFPNLTPLFLQAGGMEHVVELLSGEVHQQREGLFNLVELMWNVLEHEAEAGRALGTRQGVQMLKTLFLEILASGFQVKNKELRNELLIICTFVAADETTRPLFMETGFLEALIVCATCFELGTNSEDLQAFAMLNTKQEDFEMKKLTWNLLSLISTDPPSAKHMIEEGFLQVLLMYVDSTKQHPRMPKWASNQLLDLRLQAMSILFSLVPMGPSDFCQLGGNGTILSFLSSQTDHRLLQKALTVLLNTCGLLNFKVELGKLGAVTVLLKLMMERSNPWVVRQDAVSVLSQLSADCQENKRLLGDEDGVSILKNNLKWASGDGFQRERFVMSVVDCIWSAIVNHASNEAKFLDIDGVCAMLELLEAGPEIMRYQVLGCLADLLENDYAVEQVFDWKSRSSGRTALQLLVELWLQCDAASLANANPAFTNPSLSHSPSTRSNSQQQLQQQRKASTCSPVGPAPDEDRPHSRPSSNPHMQPAAAPEEMFEAEENEDDDSSDYEDAEEEEEGFDFATHSLSSGSAIQAMARTYGHTKSSLISGLEIVYSQDLKMAIYAVFRKLDRGWHDESMDPKHKTVLLTIKKYLEYREGEIWREIVEELASEGVQPISPDQRRFDECLHIHEEGQAEVLHQQKRLRDTKKAEALQGEKTFYQAHIEQKIAEERMMNSIHSRLGPALNFAARQEAKARKAEMLRKSLRAYVEPLSGRRHHQDSIWETDSGGGTGRQSHRSARGISSNRSSGSGGEHANHPVASRNRSHSNVSSRMVRAQTPPDGSNISGGSTLRSGRRDSVGMSARGSISPSRNNMMLVPIGHIEPSSTVELTAPPKRNKTFVASKTFLSGVSVR